MERRTKKSDGEDRPVAEDESELAPRSNPSQKQRRSRIPRPTPKTDATNVWEAKGKENVAKNGQAPRRVTFMTDETRRAWSPQGAKSMVAPGVVQSNDNQARSEGAPSKPSPSPEPGISRQDVNTHHPAFQCEKVLKFLTDNAQHCEDSTAFEETISEEEVQDTVLEFEIDLPLGYEWLDEISSSLAQTPDVGEMDGEENLEDDDLDSVEAPLPFRAGSATENPSNLAQTPDVGEMDCKENVEDGDLEQVEVPKPFRAKLLTEDPLSTLDENPSDLPQTGRVKALASRFERLALAVDPVARTRGAGPKKLLPGSRAEPGHQSKVGREEVRFADAERRASSKERVQDEAEQNGLVVIERCSLSTERVQDEDEQNGSVEIQRYASPTGAEIRQIPENTSDLSIAELANLGSTPTWDLRRSIGSGSFLDGENAAMTSFDSMSTSRTFLNATGWNAGTPTRASGSLKGLCTSLDGPDGSPATRASISAPGSVLKTPPNVQKT